MMAPRRMIDFDFSRCMYVLVVVVVVAVLILLVVVSRVGMYVMYVRTM